ncbi:hypothetical protein GVO57_14470 (plasmid) [Sphingomonas changnyeongensis]|uniref:Uncharacterized protein n=1 Tax=Sphingomonas changnyeongensis TaxID=2698679 RepID=A0A7Z2NYG1_9SPHN|nr:hypothetical protein [Sphingomonas changnyeongensis]QHL92077.1 hypothetical protein GVO57_14470 [Sphingomonas changnyeongensis]
MMFHTPLNQFVPNHTPITPVCRLLALAGVSVRSVSQHLGYAEVFCVKGLPIRIVVWADPTGAGRNINDVYDLARLVGTSVIALRSSPSLPSALPLAVDLVMHDQDWAARSNLVPALCGPNLLLVPYAGDAEAIVFDRNGLTPVPSWPWETPDDCELAIGLAARELGCL